MTAPIRSFTEIAQRGQESVAAVVRIWADLAQASVKVLTTGRSELLDGRRVAGLVFGFANQVLEGQRALLSAMTATATATATRKTAFAEIAAAPEASNGVVAETVAETTAETTEADAEVTETAAATPAEVAETTTQAAAEVAETAAETTAEVAETSADTAAEVAETTPEVAETPADTAAEGPYGKGSHAPLADRSEIPAGFEIKGNDGSKLYHVPGSAFYKRTVAEVWFATPEAAEDAGFLRPASQR